MKIDDSYKVFLYDLSKRIKSLRESRNLTQEDAYNDTGIHFGRIESANSDIKLSTLVKISEYFNIKLSEFFAEGFDK